MSAFFASKQTIDLIVSGAIELALTTYLPPHKAPVLIIEDNADDFGRMLWEENRRAVVARYGERAEGERLTQTVADYRLRRYIGVKPTGLYALARFLDYQCDEDASFAQSNACLGLRAIMGAVASSHDLAAIKEAAESLPFGVLKETDVAAFLAPGWS